MQKGLLILFCFLSSSCSIIDLDLWEEFDSDTTYLAIKDQKMMKVGFVDPSGHPIFSWSDQYQAWDEDLLNDIAGIQVALSSQKAYVRTPANIIKEKDGTSWAFSFEASDFKIGKNDQIYFIGNNGHSSGQGFEIYKWDEGTGQMLINGAAIKVAVDVNGLLWIVDSYNGIQQWTGSSWLEREVQATDIIIGDYNTPFIVGTEPAEGGKIIQKWNTDSNSWETLPGIGGVSLALDSEENPYVVTEDHKVYRQKGLVYSFCPGKPNVLIFSRIDSMYHGLCQLCKLR